MTKLEAPTQRNGHTGTKWGLKFSSSSNIPCKDKKVVGLLEQWIKDRVIQPNVEPLSTVEDMKHPRNCW